MKKSEATYLFGVSISSLKRYVRAWSTYVVSSGQARQTCKDDEGCAPLPDRSLLQCKNQPMGLPDPGIAETAFGAVASPDLGTSSFLWWHTQIGTRVWASHHRVGA